MTRTLEWLQQAGPTHAKHRGWLHPVVVCFLHYMIVFRITFWMHDWLVGKIFIFGINQAPECRQFGERENQVAPSSQYTNASSSCLRNGEDLTYQHLPNTLFTVKCSMHQQLLDGENTIRQNLWLASHCIANSTRRKRNSGKLSACEYTTARPITTANKAKGIWL